MKRAAASLARGEPAAKRRSTMKPSEFHAELSKLQAFVEAHDKLPRIGVGQRAKAKAAAGMYSQGANPLPQNKFTVPSSERGLRLFLDRKLREHKALMKVVCARIYITDWRSYL